MRKRPHLLNHRRRRRHGILGRLSGKVVDCVQHDNVGCVWRFRVSRSAACDVGVEFWCGDGRQVRGVAAGDGDAVGGV